MAPRRVLIDTDPGVDDTMAILLALASPEVVVEGLTVVYGNTDAEQCARNALAVLEVAGRPDLPVAVGARRPLLRPYTGRGRQVHGADGLGETGLGAGRPVPEGNAVEFLIARAREAPGELTVLALGPLTTLALAVSVEPRLAQWVREVVLMGGGVRERGNATPVAEANFHNDAESARIVLHAGWPVTMVGLDVTHRVIMTPAHLARLAAARTPVTELIGAITPFYLRAARQFAGIDGFFVHDPTAVTYLLRPEWFTTQELYVDVVTDSERARGQTIADFRGQWGQPPNVRVCLEVDAERELALYLERVTAYRPGAAPS
ncbi:MAG: nucleoside hydrolase [Armatimonadota bacterium]|nr:nucleoside hydrolase [Armatimonadota bacterium]MDR7448049.1 nucleoside hydrolase [Armatimonadota bacterium]MDR7459598.1 nucleoside hydrolase [Armatimonadota bacterium]MDR7478643.1 nucleoside hydrolase [Armatimonadota bacterium]MDR7488038.1 nucleoside hydrolase [Armatimonadota bacterium]